MHGKTIENEIVKIFFFWIQSLSLLSVQVNYFLETLNPFSIPQKRASGIPNLIFANILMVVILQDII
jgi:hypothetical protein